MASQGKDSIKNMHKFISAIDTLNEWVGRQVSWLTAVLVLLVCVDVLFRYLFNDTQTWIMELEWHLFALIFLLGAGYAFKHNRHVRVDLFYAKFSERDKAWVNLIGNIVFLLPWTILIIILSYKNAYGSWLIGERSPTPGGLGARYLIKFSITIGFILLFLQALAEAGKAWMVLRKNKNA